MPGRNRNGNRPPNEPTPPVDYVVGHGRPPREHQFRPGQSGNRRGRPRGSRNFSSIFAEEANRTISVTEEGRIRRLSRLHAFILRVWNDGLQGKPRAMDLLLTLCERFGVEAITAAVPQSLNVDEQQLLAELARRASTRDGRSDD